MSQPEAFKIPYKSNRDGVHMKNALHRFGRFYSKIMVQMIGVFIFAGLLSVVFGDYGWLPNKDMYAISQFVYSYLVPLLVAYLAGNQVGKRQDEEKEKRDISATKNAGGVMAALAVTGLLLAEKDCAFIGAMILGPFCGYLWRWGLELWTKKVMPGLEMLTRNLLVAGAATLLATLSYYVLAPAMMAVVKVFMTGINWLVERNLLCFVSVVIEPTKVFFLNNCINHGILLPLAVQQTEAVGSSIFYLLESNPGPGFGLLLALWLSRKKRRKEYGAYLFVEGIGGIHELYFPEVLANLWLLLPLILGGMAGNLVFSLFHVTAVGAISPGSVISILLMTGHKAPLALVGMAVSGGVSALFSLVILQMQERERAALEEEKKSLPEESEKVSVLENPEDLGALSQPIPKEGPLKLGFVCDAGVGSSAMGAGLFRRILREQGLEGALVEAYGADQVPKDLDLIVCQKNFKEMLRQEGVFCPMETMESLLNREEQLRLMEKLKKEGFLS